jgi:hypothetical protein
MVMAVKSVSSGGHAERVSIVTVLLYLPTVSRWPGSGKKRPFWGREAVVPCGGGPTAYVVALA